MQTLQIEKGNLQKAYGQADEKGKQLLQNLFGKKEFIPITERVKSYSDACVVLGIPPCTVLVTTTDKLDSDAASIYAYAMLIVIARALNEGWEPDWSDHTQYKWYPYFEFKPGFGFSSTYYAHWYAHTNVGSRLCYKTSELAEYAGKQFDKIYQDFLTINQYTDGKSNNCG